MPLLFFAAIAEHVAFRADRKRLQLMCAHPGFIAQANLHGHRVRPLGVEHFGQTGSLAELYRHYGIDANGIIAAAQAIAPGRPIRHLRIAT